VCVLDKSEYSAFESMLNSSIASLYSIRQMPIDRGAKEAQEAKKFRAGLSPKPPVRAAPAVRSVSK